MPSKRISVIHKARCPYCDFICELGEMWITNCEHLKEMNSEYADFYEDENCELSGGLHDSERMFE